jgi:hypothetical protein
MVTEAEMKSKQLLKDYSLEEILEAAEVTPEEALEYLVTYGIVPADLEMIEAVDGTPED